MDPVTMAIMAGASAGAGLFNDSQNRDFNAREAQKNRNFQREERLATQQFTLDMWNMNNEYNSLSSQVQRAKEAGFSPNAVLDGGSSSSSPVTSSPMAGAQASFSSSMSPVLANIGKTIAETNLINQQARGQSLTNTFDSQSMKERLALISKNVEGLSTTIKKDLAEIGKTDIETKTLKKAFEYFADMQDAELAIKLESLNNLRNQNLKLVEEITNTKKQGELLDENVSNAKKQGELLDENVESAGMDNDMKSLELAVSKVTGIPVGTPEHDAVLYMWANGTLPAYVRDVRTPLERAGWKAVDYEVPDGYYDFNFDPRKGYTSPHLKLGAYRYEKNSILPK